MSVSLLLNSVKYKRYKKILNLKFKFNIAVSFSIFMMANYKKIDYYTIFWRKTSIKFVILVHWAWFTAYYKALSKKNSYQFQNLKIGIFTRDKTLGSRKPMTFSRFHFFLKNHFFLILIKNLNSRVFFRPGKVFLKNYIDKTWFINMKSNFA